MRNPLRILLVEDVAADAELALQEFKRANIRVDSRRVDTHAAFWRALEEFHPDVILSDFSMPGFDGMEALRIARRAYPDIPFIFVSGTIGEESAVLALREGARDYVLKGNLLRLPPAVERAIKEAEERRVRIAHDQELRTSERLYRTLFASQPQPMLVYDVETQHILTANDAAVARYGHPLETLLTMTLLDIFPSGTATRDDTGELSVRDFVLAGKPVRVIIG